MRAYTEVDGAEPFLTSGAFIAFEREQLISAGTASGHSIDVDVPVMHYCDAGHLPCPGGGAAAD